MIVEITQSLSIMVIRQNELHKKLELTDNATKRCNLGLFSPQEKSSKQREHSHSHHAIDLSLLERNYNLTLL